MILLRSQLQRERKKNFLTFLIKIQTVIFEKKPVAEYLNQLKKITQIKITKISFFSFYLFIHFFFFFWSWRIERPPTWIVLQVKLVKSMEGVLMCLKKKKKLQIIEKMNPLILFNSSSSLLSKQFSRIRNKKKQGTYNMNEYYILFSCKFNLLLFLIHAYRAYQLTDHMAPASFCRITFIFVVKKNQYDQIK